MSDNIDTRVTPALHPDNVKEIEGYDDETSVCLGPMVQALSEAYQGISSVHTARDAARSNPTWNENQVIIATDDLARKHLDRITRLWDSTRANLVRSITALEQELSAPVASRAAAPIAAEIRNYVRSLPTGKLHAFIQNAIDNGDADTVSSVLGAPAYLSGLTPEFQQTYLRFYHEQRSPGTAKRLKVLKGACAMIEQRAGLVFSELTKAVGAPPHKARALREAKTAAEKHFVMAGA